MGAPGSGSPWGAGSRRQSRQRAAVVSGSVEEDVEEEVTHTLPQGGRVDQGGRPDALCGAGCVEL